MARDKHRVHSQRNSQFSSSINEHLEHRFDIPYMKMNAIVLLIKLRGSADSFFETFHFFNVSNPLLIVALSGSLRTLVVVLNQMSERRHFSARIKSFFLIREREKEPTLRTQDSSKGLQRSKRVFGMFQKVIGDQKVLTFVGKAAQSLPIVEDVRSLDWIVLQLGIFQQQIWQIHPIDVGDFRPNSNRQRVMQRTDFEAAPSESTKREILAREALLRLEASQPAMKSAAKVH